jgi:hypothetical protein
MRTVEMLMKPPQGNVVFDAKAHAHRIAVAAHMFYRIRVLSGQQPDDPGRAHKLGEHDQILARGLVEQNPEALPLLQAKHDALLEKKPPHQHSLALPA